VTSYLQTCNMSEKTKGLGKVPRTKTVQLKKKPPPNSQESPGKGKLVEGRTSEPDGLKEKANKEILLRKGVRLRLKRSKPVNG